MSVRRMWFCDALGCERSTPAGAPEAGWLEVIDGDDRAHVCSADHLVGLVVVGMADALRMASVEQSDLLAALDAVMRRARMGHSMTKFVLHSFTQLSDGNWVTGTAGPDGASWLLDTEGVPSSEAEVNRFLAPMADVLARFDDETSRVIAIDGVEVWSRADDTDAEPWAAAGEGGSVTQLHPPQHPSESGTEPS